MAEDEIRSLGEITAKVVENLGFHENIQEEDPVTPVPETKPVVRRRITDKEARLKAIEVYERAKLENLSQPDAVRLYGSTRHSVSEAGLILENGTTVEVENIRTGLVALASTIRNIRKRLPRHVIKGKKPSPRRGN